MTRTEGWAILGGVAVGGTIGAMLLVLLAPRLRASGATRPPAGAPIAGPSSPSSLPAPAPGTPVASPTPPLLDAPRLESLRPEVRRAARRSGGTACLATADEVLQEGSGAPLSQPRLLGLPLAVAMHQAWHTGFLQRSADDEKRVVLAITEGSPAAMQTLLARLGASQATDALHALGFTETHFRRGATLPGAPTSPAPQDNVTTPRDLARMLLQITEGKLVSPRAAAELQPLVADYNGRELAAAWQGCAVRRLPQGNHLAAAVFTSRGQPQPRAARQLLNNLTNEQP